MSKLQKFARGRNSTIWRVRGMYISTQFLSKEEKKKADIINQLLAQLKENFTEESIKLGLKAKYRCYCGKPKRDKEVPYCKKCQELYKEYET